MSRPSSTLTISLVSLLVAVTIAGLALSGYFSTTGQAGPQGASGPAGTTGQAGPAGAQGATGPQGPAGAQGAAGPAGPAGAAGQAGPAGPAGAAGQAGPAGAQGATGPAGPQGASGIVAGSDLKSEITKVEIGADRRPIVTFKITDSKGTPLKISDLDGNPSFGIAAMKIDETTKLSQYLNYYVSTVKGNTYTVNGVTKQPVLTSAQQAGLGPAGKITDLGNGVFTYAFNYTLPDNYDKSATHLVGGQMTRGGRTYVANPIYFFVPAGGEVKVNRLASKTETCNQCHDPLAIHGGTRREVSLCLLCHSALTTDPESGNTVDLKVMVHKIHNGNNLASTKNGTTYQIIGYRQSYFNFSQVAFPDDVRNCSKCHTGPQGDVWKTSPSRAACGSCHDDVNFATGKNHPGGPQSNDSTCKLCHSATMTQEFDTSVPGAHVIPKRSNQLPGINITIVKISNTAPGEKPVVVFNIKDKKGNPIEPTKIYSLAFILGGPTTDYATPGVYEINVQQAGKTKALGNGNYEYTFTAAIPSNATGTFALATQAYNPVNLTAPSTYVNRAALLNVRDVEFNKVVYFPVTDAKAVARRTVVNLKSCESCHTQLDFFHGTARRNTELCVLCHNPTFTSPARDPAIGTANVPIDFKYMIHRIHEGEEQSVPYKFGARRTYDFSEVLFPGDLRNCGKCHVAGTNTLPMKDGIQGSVVIKSTSPVTTVCSSCHDTKAAAGHMDINTSQKGVETCNVCHAEGREVAVSTAHARP